MKFSGFLTRYWSLILAIAVFGAIYFSVDARTLLIRGLMRTGLFKANIEDDRARLIKSNGWEVPPGIMLADSIGRKVILSEQKGRVLFVNFWATWCPPCRAEMPSIDALKRKVENNKNIEFYMVDADGKTEAAVRFMKSKNYSLPVYTPSSFLPPEIFDGNLPTTLVIADGKIVYHHIGAADYDDPKFLQFIENLSN